MNATELYKENLLLRELLHDSHSALLMVHVAPHGPNYLQWISNIIDRNQAFFIAGEAGKKENASLPDFSAGKEAGLPAGKHPFELPSPPGNEGKQ